MTAAGDRPQTLLSDKEQQKLRAIYRSPFYKRLIAARCQVAEELNIKREDTYVLPIVH